MKKKMTYEEWQEAKIQAKMNYHGLTEPKKEMANMMYLILTHEHKGKDNVICADALAEEMSVYLDKEINRGHVNECARLFRDTGRFPGLQSCTKGYFVDESLSAMLRTLRFVYTKSLQIERTANNIKNVIAKKHGEKAVPADLRFWIEQMDFEEWCEDNDFHPSDEWCYEHGYDPIENGDS